MKRTFILLMSAAALIAVSGSRCTAEIIEVPGDHSNITLALEATSANDTILVHPGTYEDRLIFPAHDVVMISEYVLTGDSSAIDCTIIDASSFANEDTASVLAFVYGNTRATVVGGFTLMGGHGTVLSPSNPTHRRGGALHVIESSPTIHSCRITGNEAAGGFVFFSDYGAPRISHCEITGNCGQWAMHLQNNYMLPDPAIFEWNDIHGNFACNSPFPWVVGQCLNCNYSFVIARFNRFHDYEGEGYLGLYFYETRAEAYGNVFEDLSIAEGADRTGVIGSTSYANTFRDNQFRNCHLHGWECIALTAQTFGNHNPYRSIVERNWFESIVKTGTGASCLYLQRPNADIRENVFFDCQGTAGTSQFSQNPPYGCEAAFERNYFFYNRATSDDPDQLGSVFNSVGGGPPCTFADNWFEGNRGPTLHLDTTISPQADLSHNYWGHFSGPYHPTENPFGQGDTVPENVHVTPWLTEPPGMSESIKKRLTLSPQDWSLEQPYPNPFNATTTLRLFSSNPQPFEVAAYNTLGQRVARVWQGVVPKETPVDVRWDGQGERGQIASGIYYLVAIPRGPGASAPKSTKAVLLR